MTARVWRMASKATQPRGTHINFSAQDVIRTRTSAYTLTRSQVGRVYHFATWAWSGGRDSDPQLQNGKSGV